jgi:hypothetical protein
MKLTQKQCEAFADILVLAMCIDGHFSLAEEEEIQKGIESIGWDENLSPALHLGSSIAKARDIIGHPQQVRSYLEALVPVIGEPQIANFIFEETLKVLSSDGTNADEGVFISQLKAILKV